MFVIIITHCTRFHKVISVAIHSKTVQWRSQNFIHTKTSWTPRRGECQTRSAVFHAKWLVETSSLHLDDIPITQVAAVMHNWQRQQRLSIMHKSWLKQRQSEWGHLGPESRLIPTRKKLLKLQFDRENMKPSSRWIPVKEKRGEQGRISTRKWWLNKKSEARFSYFEGQNAVQDTILLWWNNCSILLWFTAEPPQKIVLHKLATSAGIDIQNTPKKFTSHNKNNFPTKWLRQLLNFIYATTFHEWCQGNQII